MKKLLVPLLTVVLLTTACASPLKDTEKKTIPTGNIHTQTATAIEVNLKSDDYTKSLESGKFYVAEDKSKNVKRFYEMPKIVPLGEEDDFDLDSVPNQSQTYYADEDIDVEIPTLFPGDKLYLYQKSGFIDYFIWNRLYDLRYSVGIANLSISESGKVYGIYSSEADDNSFIDKKAIEATKSSDENGVYIDKIGSTKITKDNIDKGIIKGMSYNSTFPVDLYIGTVYKHLSLKASYHFFSQYELFASAEALPLQDKLYEIPVPEYLPTGYYLLSGQIVRVVRKKSSASPSGSAVSYNDDTDFNKQVLFPADYDDEEEETTQVYSSTPRLNSFTTNEIGKLGYFAKTKDDLEDDEEITKDIAIAASVQKDFSIHLPKKDCSVLVKSSTREMQGDVYITFNDEKTVTASYDYKKDGYLIKTKGNDEDATLTVRGLFTGYEVTLTNATLNESSEDGD